MRHQNQQVQLHIPKMGPVVKVLLITAGLTFLLQLILNRSTDIFLSGILGFIPLQMLSGWIWQPVTYAFLHGGPFHLLFNLLILWSIGSELEHVWGGRFFLVYFFACSIGAAVTYALFTAMGIGDPGIPVVGMSGAVYGLLLAYGILFGDRVLYFFMIFPMPAKYFVMILGGIVLVSTVFYSQGGVAHTAHLGGMVVGLALLLSVTAWKQRQRAEVALERERRERQKRVRSASHLKLVPGDSDDDDDGNPQIWH